MKGRPDLPPFTSRMEPRELICTLVWIPMHFLVLPRLAFSMMERGAITEAQANLLFYSSGALFLVLTCFSFLRRDFDPLCEHPFYCFGQIALSYAMMMALNLIVSGALSMLLSALDRTTFSNQNNEAVISLVREDSGRMTAMAVFLAPLAEELMFRGALFGTLRRYHRTAAYLLSILLFSVYHVWSFAIYDASYWIYLLQYLPAAWLLCRCYERTDSIWCSIFFHMLINWVSIRMLLFLEELL